MSNTYWNNRGKYQSVLEKLQALIPDQGSVRNPVKNKALERFRRASNSYYRMYNDGDFKAATAKMFGITAPFYSLMTTKEVATRYPTKRFTTKVIKQSTYDSVEVGMDAIIQAALAEQQIIC